MIYWFDKSETAGGLGSQAGQKQVRILLVEDDLRFAESMAMLLRNADWETEARHTGREGIDRLAENDFDLLLVDINLPDMTGHDVIRAVQAAGHTLPVIVVSGESEIDVAIDALRLGAVDYVRKPIEPAFLLHRIRKALKESMLEHECRISQKRITQSERLHRFLVDQSLDLIFTLDHDGRVTFVNDRFPDRVGQPRHAILGHPFADLVHPLDRDLARYTLSRDKLGASNFHSLELRLNNPSDPKGYSHYEMRLAAVSCVMSKDSPQEAGRDGNDANCLYGVARDISDRREAEEWATYQANHDLLTGLPNRNLFRDRVSLAVTQARRNQERFAVLFLNLNRFNILNELYGHAKADELLQDVAERIQQCLRGGDTLARFAGDEFLIMTSAIAGQDDVVAVIDRINHSLSRPFEVGDHHLPISASMGVALFPEHGETAEVLIRHANIALYHGRLAGKTRHSFFVEEMRSYADAKLRVEHELRQAIGHGELELYFQPQVNVTDRHLKGVEALIRWNHPQRGLLTPGDFIPIAEETGLILQISEWVIEEACRKINHWDECGVPLPRVSINISPRYLDQPNFVERVTTLIEQHKVDPARLEVELTENLFIRDPAAVINKLNALAAQGIKIAIDDFGTQYSSLSYLQKFPIHTLKIDKSFVWEIDREYRKLAIIKAIISIGRSLDLNLIAEGVETDEQMAFLESHGCNEIQGYLISRPLTSAALESLIKQDLRQSDCQVA